MGACFQLMTLEGSMIRNDVKARFERAQDDDRYENGHSYSGGFGMCSGLDFAPKTFDSVRDAEAWLADNAQKWEAALCVTAKDGDATKWVIGAWCSS